MPARSYRADTRRTDRAGATRRRITDAVAALMAEGAFHESTVEQVAQRAGVSRATLYGHFGSRLDLIDGICERFDENPALLAIREAVGAPDPDSAVTGTIANAVAFWSSEDPILAQLYGVAAVDPAAREFVGRQRDDRRGEMTRLTARLARDGWLRPGMTAAGALPLVMVLTSYETFCELRRAGASDEEIVATLARSMRELLSA